MMNTKNSSALFATHRQKLQEMVWEKKSRLVQKGSWQEELQEAKRDLEAWEKKSGREQKYTSESLAEARLVRQTANEYEEANRFDLVRADGLHQAEIGESIISSGLSRRLVEEGKKGLKFGLLELSARLAPVLTFPGSSSYFEVGVIPYGKESRRALGEGESRNFVSGEVARESAMNLGRKFGVHYGLAETSAAPRSDVPKSARKPQVYICAVAGSEIAIEKHHSMETPFRSEFNAQVRQLMYDVLNLLYGNRD